MRSLACTLVLLCITATSAAGDTLGEAATEAFITERLHDIAAMSGDPHILLLAASTHRDPAWFLERAYRAAPYDTLVLLQVDALCERTLADHPFCDETDWAEALRENDPDNGANWLRIARRAAASGGLERTRSGLRAAAERARYDAYTGAFAYAMYQALHRLSPDGRTLDPFVVGANAMEITASIPQADLDFVPACRAFAADDAHIAHLCRVIAGHLIESPSSVQAALAAADWLERADGLSATERARIERLGEAYTDANRALEGFERRLRDDHALIDRFFEDMARHGKYAAWLRAREMITDR